MTTMSFLEALKRAIRQAGYQWIIPITETDPHLWQTTYTWKAGSRAEEDERSVVALVLNPNVLETVVVTDGDSFERKPTLDSLLVCLCTMILPRTVPEEGARTDAYLQDSPS